MGTLSQMLLKTLEWWSILLKVLEVHMTLVDKVVFNKNWWLGSDAIPFQFLQYPHNTWIWVGLNWKFMYFSMGSLLDKCHRGLGRKLPPMTAGHKKKGDLNRLCSPRLAICHYWGAQLIGEVPVLEYVSERLWLMIRIQSMIIQGSLPLTDGCKCCGIRVRPLQSVKLFE